MSSLAHLLFEKSNAHASREALRVRGRSIAYRELSVRALAVAAALVDAGANRETVGIVGQRKAASYVGILGILYAGCRYVPVNPKYSEARLGAMLRDAEVRFLVGDRADLEALSPVLSGSAAPSIEASFCQRARRRPEAAGWMSGQSAN